MDINWILYLGIVAVSGLWAYFRGARHALLDPLFWIVLCVVSFGICVASRYSDVLLQKPRVDWDIALLYLGALALGSAVVIGAHLLIEGFAAFRAFAEAGRVVEDTHIPPLPDFPEIASIPTRPMYTLPPFLEEDCRGKKVDVTI